MIEIRFRTMPPHSTMPRSIPRLMSGRNRHLPMPPRIDRRSPDDSYGAGFNGAASRHTVQKLSRINRPKHSDEYIGPIDVIPGEPLYVIAQTRGVSISGEFVPQPATTPADALVFAAKARIGLNQEGSFAVLAAAAGYSLKMRVVNAAGLLQEISVITPSYDRSLLNVKHLDSLIIVSAKQV